MKKHYSTPVALYPATLHLSVCSAKAWLRYLHKFSDVEVESNDPDGECVMLTGNTIEIFIRIRLWKPEPMWQALLVHECFHALSYLTEHLGITGGEAHAYLLQSLTETCFKALDVKKK